MRSAYFGAIQRYRQFIWGCVLCNQVDNVEDGGSTFPTFYFWQNAILAAVPARNISSRTALSGMVSGWSSLPFLTEMVRFSKSTTSWSVPPAPHWSKSGAGPLSILCSKQTTEVKTNLNKVNHKGWALWSVMPAGTQAPPQTNPWWPKKINLSPN